MKKYILPGGLLCLITAALYVYPIVIGAEIGGGIVSDSRIFHIPQILVFQENNFDLISYKAFATTLPFYHAFMAWIAAALGIETITVASPGIRIVHLILSAVGLAVFIGTLFSVTSPGNATIFAIPILTSWYVASGAIFIGTDGPGFSLLLIALAVTTMRFCGRQLVMAGLFALIAGVRHLYLPYACILFLASGALAGRKQLLQAALAIIPGCFLLAFYIVRWGGLVPPGIASELNPEGLYLYNILGHFSIVGIWGVAFAVLRHERWRHLLATPQVIMAVLLSSLAMVTIWLVVPTDFNQPAGRFGSIAWRLGDVLTIGDKSPVILILAMLGASILVILTTDLFHERLNTSAVIALTIFLVSLSATYAGYQRYSEPAILATFALSLAQLSKTRLSYIRTIPLLIISIASSVVTLQRLIFIP